MAASSADGNGKSGWEYYDGGDRSRRNRGRWPRSATDTAPLKALSGLARTTTSGWRCPTRPSASCWRRSTPRSCSSPCPTSSGASSSTRWPRSNSFYLLWMILGYLIVSSVLVVSLGRLGDIHGRVKMYNLGFVIYTSASLLLAVDWMTGAAGANWLIGMRVVQGIGGAFSMANSAAILTDAFPANQRGMALRHQQRGRHHRDLRRPRARRRAGADRLAAGVPRLRAPRPVRHDLGLPRSSSNRANATRRRSTGWATSRSPSA